MPEHFQHTLSNGLVVLAEPTPTAHSFACGVFVRAGTRDEPEPLNGVSHFLEHMLFKGSHDRNAAAMNRVFDDMGANYNAFTTQELTAYYAGVLPEHTEALVEHLAHLFRPALRSSDFETEKQVILEEIAMYADEPSHRVFEELAARHYAGHPLAMSVLGPAEAIRQMTRDAMHDYFYRHYGPSDAVLAVTGRFDFERVVELAERHLGGWRGGGAGRVARDVPSHAGRHDLTDANVQRLYVAAMSTAPSAQDPDRYAARVWCDIAGDGDGSRLYWALVDPAECEEADLSFQAGDGTGAYVLSLVCDPGRGDRVLEVARRELDRLAGDLSDAEITRAKNKIAGASVLHGESPMGRMRAIGAGWAYEGVYKPLDAELDAILSVTRQDVLRLLERFPPSLHAVVTLGPEA